VKFRKLLCYLFGHRLLVVTRIDNGTSVFGHMKCQRCGYEEMYQYDNV
jgi:predicted nucleic-acid-binding Zn-ribbon protein